MKLQIPVHGARDLFIKYLLFLNPILKLTEKTEMPVLASFLVLYNRHHHRYHDKKVLNEHLLSDNTKELIRNDLKMTKTVFKRVMNSLDKKEMLKENGEGINFKILYPIIKKDYEIRITFKETPKHERGSADTSMQEVSTPNVSN